MVAIPFDLSNYEIPKMDRLAPIQSMESPTGITLEPIFMDIFVVGTV